MQESKSESLHSSVARVEERIIALDKRVQDIQKLLAQSTLKTESRVEGLKKQLSDHSSDITKFKRDRYWIVMLMTFGFGLLSAWIKTKY